MYEMTKGEDSFWAPYFEITEKTDMVGFWNKEDLDECEDPLLTAQA